MRLAYVMPFDVRLCALLAILVIGCGRAGSGSQGSSSAPDKAAAAAAKALTPEQVQKLATERHGGELYARMCAVCHAAHGEGYKADQAPALAQPDFLASVSDGFLRRAIAEGRSGTPMSAWSSARGGPLAPADVDAVIAFLRSWEKRPRVPLDERPLHGDAERGATIFARQCASCHGTAGTGGPSVRIGKSELLAVASNGFLRLAVRNGRRGTAMAAFAPTLGDTAVEDVVTYLRSLYKASPGAPPTIPRPPPLPLGRVPLNPKGPEPSDFSLYPATTSVDVVHAAMEKHARLALLDARAPTDYTIEHIAGAVSVPFYDPTPYFKALPKNAWLVCYCSCPSAESSELAQKLLTAGFTKVTVLKEGFGMWGVKKYPTRKGDKP